MASIKFGQLAGAQPAQPTGQPAAAAVATAPAAAPAAPAVPQFKVAAPAAPPAAPVAPVAPAPVAAAPAAPVAPAAPTAPAQAVPAQPTGGFKTPGQKRQAGQGFKQARTVTAVAAQADAQAAQEAAAGTTVAQTAVVANCQVLPPEAPAAPQSGQMALAPAQTAAIATRSPFGNLLEGDGDMDFRDLQLPRINLVQKSGQLADQFDPGDIVFNKELALPQPVVFILLGFRKTSFIQRVAQGEEGMVCHSEVEVAQAGGTTEWTEHQATGKPLFQRYTTALVLLQAPPGTPEQIVANYYPYELGGTSWAIAAWSMKGPSYTNVVKPLKTARRFGYLRQGFHTCMHTLHSTLKNYNTGNSGYVPKVERVPGGVSEEFLSELTALMTSFAGGEE